MVEQAYGPMALLADSQLLFSPIKGQILMQWVEKQLIDRQCSALNNARRALYLGASNGNESAYYQMAVEICRAWGIENVVNGVDESQFVGFPPESFDVVLLAGGDVALGWAFLSSSSVTQWLRAFSFAQGVLIGISAGAIHLSSAYCVENSQHRQFLGFYPASLVMHEEGDDWPTVKAWKHSKKVGADEKGLDVLCCIPFGGGLLIESDQSQAHFQSQP